MLAVPFGVLVRLAQTIGQTEPGLGRGRIAREGRAVIGLHGAGVAETRIDLDPPEIGLGVARGVAHPALQGDAGALQVVGFQVNPRERLVKERVGRRVLVERLTQEWLGLGEAAHESVGDRRDAAQLVGRRVQGAGALEGGVGLGESTVGQRESSPPELRRAHQACAPASVRAARCRRRLLPSARLARRDPTHGTRPRIPALPPLPPRRPRRNPDGALSTILVPQQSLTRASLIHERVLITVIRKRVHSSDLIGQGQADLRRP